MFKENYKKYLAEFIGTAVLVLVACGVAMFTRTASGWAFALEVNVVATALAFGLVIVAMAYSIGQISGCHINPAVTLAVWINKRIDGRSACFYVISQLLGGLFGGLILFLMIKLKGLDPAGNMGTNALPTVSEGGNALVLGLLVEIILTFVFTFTIIGVTSKKEYSKKAGLVIGLTLTLVHLFGINVTGTSVNPARSLGVAFFDTTNIKDIWVFIAGPLAGGALGGLLGKFFFKPEEVSEEITVQ